MRIRHVALAVLAVATLCSCSAAGQTASSASPSEDNATTGASTSPTPSQLLPVDGVAPGTHAPATWSEADRQEVVAAAEQALATFGRPQLPYDVWWAELEPLLSQKAAQDYANVDPANVPVQLITGPGKIVDDTSAYVAQVAVPTNAGEYILLMMRKQGGDPWLVERFQPPEN